MPSLMKSSAKSLIVSLHLTAMFLNSWPVTIKLWELLAIQQTET